MKLTEHFDSSEFGENLSDQELQNFYMLCVLVLEPLRDRWGIVKITSGKRSPEKNAAVGGVGSSQHRLSEAADFICPFAAGQTGAVFRWILDDLKWPGEVIWYRRKGHIHVALPRYNVKADHFVKEE